MSTALQAKKMVRTFLPLHLQRFALHVMVKSTIQHTASVQHNAMSVFAWFVDVRPAVALRMMKIEIVGMRWTVLRYICGTPCQYCGFSIFLLVYIEGVWGWWDMSWGYTHSN